MKLEINKNKAISLLLSMLLSFLLNLLINVLIRLPKPSTKACVKPSAMTNISYVKHSAKTSIELSPESFVKPSVQSFIKPSAKPFPKPSAVIFSTNAVIRHKILLRPKFLLGTRCPDAATFSTSGAGGSTRREAI